MIELILNNAPQACQDGGLPLIAAVMLAASFLAASEWIESNA